jgi:hypothetical protein
VRKKGTCAKEVGVSDKFGGTNARQRSDKFQWRHKRKAEVKWAHLFVTVVAPTEVDHIV